MAAMRWLDHIPFSFEISTAGTVKWAVALISAWWMHDIAAPMRALMWFMAIDYATGLLAAMVERKLNSRAGFVGLVSKGGILALLLMSHHIETLIHQELNLETWGAVAYSVNELVSIVENLARCGVPIPRPLVLALLAAKHLRVQVASKEEIMSLHAAAVAVDTNQTVHRIEETVTAPQPPAL